MSPSFKYFSRNENAPTNYSVRNFLKKIFSGGFFFQAPEQGLLVTGSLFFPKDTEKKDKLLAVKTVQLNYFKLNI